MSSFKLIGNFVVMDETDRNHGLTCNSLIFFCSCIARACSSSILLCRLLISNSFLLGEQHVSSHRVFFSVCN